MYAHLCTCFINDNQEHWKLLHFFIFLFIVELSVYSGEEHFIGINCGEKQLIYSCILLILSKKEYLYEGSKEGNKKKVGTGGVFFRFFYIVLLCIHVCSYYYEQRLLPHAAFRIWRSHCDLSLAFFYDHVNIHMAAGFCVLLTYSV
jgi:hypothetical protein